MKDPGIFSSLLAGCLVWYLCAVFSPAFAEEDGLQFDFFFTKAKTESEKHTTARRSIEKPDAEQDVRIKRKSQSPPAAAAKPEGKAAQPHRTGKQTAVKTALPGKTQPDTAPPINKSGLGKQSRPAAIEASSVPHTAGGKALQPPADYPASCYADDVLSRVREWEKIWVGKRITKENVGQVEQFLPQHVADVYKNPEKWGAPAGGFYFSIVPYRQIVDTKGMIAATRKFAPQVKTNSDGIIENYARIAGLPFPHPATGIQMAYNFDLNTHGDSSHYRRLVPNINPQSSSDRVSDQEQWELFFINRVDADPRPAFPKNPKNIRRGIFLHMYKPPEFLNTRYYSLRYIDNTKSDDLYLWYSQFRRIRRMSTAQRTDAIDGSDLIYDDEFFWDGHVVRNTYSYKGTRDLLSTRHQDMRETTRQSGQAVFNGLTFERSSLLVVEAVNKDPYYIYGKRVWYLDPETYLMLWTEIYDNLGRYWKCFIQHTNNLQTVNGEMKNFIVGSTFLDFQRNHAGSSNQTVYEISGAVEPRMFTTSYLQRTY